MGIENIKINTMTDLEILSGLYDEGVFTEICPELGSLGEKAGAVAAFGKVSDMNVYAFVQRGEKDSGSMSVVGANKLLKLYSMALHTGYPIVGFYRTSAGKITEGNMLLDAVGELLSFSTQLSGVVPQISVLLGDCISSTALLASNADFIVKAKGTAFSISDCGCSGEGKASILVDNDVQALEAIKSILSYVPANNLSLAPVAFDVTEEAAVDFDSAFDSQQKLLLFEKTMKDAEVSLNRLMGATVGVVKTVGEMLEAKTATRIASFVRFCDAFSIPVITAVDCEGFKCLSSTKTLLSAYAEATTPKISVVTGKACGISYMTLAGRGAGVDAVIGIEGAVVSPASAEATAYILLGDKLKEGTVAEQDKLIKDFIATELSVTTAARQGFIDAVCDYSVLRGILVNYLDVLSAKRVETMPKKHSTI